MGVHGWRHPEVSTCIHHAISFGRRSNACLGRVEKRRRCTGRSVVCWTDVSGAAGTLVQQLHRRAQLLQQAETGDAGAAHVARHLAMRHYTNSTAIAAARSKRNEQQTLAEGSLTGERRVAIARVVMAGMRSCLMKAPRLLGHEPETPLHSVVAIAYVGVAFAIYLPRRTTRPDPNRSSRHAPLMTILDFAFVSVLAILDHGEDGRARDASDRVRDPDRVHAELCSAARR